MSELAGFRSMVYATLTDKIVIVTDNIAKEVASHALATLTQNSCVRGTPPPFSCVRCLSKRTATNGKGA